MLFTYIVQRIGPYHNARFIKLSRDLKILNYDLLIIEISKSDDIYDWDILDDSKNISYRKITLFENNYNPITSTFLKLFKLLKLENPDFVFIPGWGSKEALFTLFFSKLIGFKSIVMSDSSEFDYTRNSLIEFLKKCIVTRFNAAFVAGTSSSNYIQNLGMPKDRITKGYDVVDNDFFKRSKTNNYDPNGYFLSIGRFIKRKNFISLLYAYKIYMRVVNNPKILYICGSGDQFHEIRKKITLLNLNDFVKLPGFIQYDKLPDFYSRASVFIIPSKSEQWGLVINEAMASGLPILASHMCGAQYDLISNNENGFIFNPFDVNDIANSMIKFHNLNFDTKMEFSYKSIQIIDNWSLSHFSKNFIKSAKISLYDKK